MLSKLKSDISDIPNIDFGDFYQLYVARMEDTIIQNDIKKASAVFKSMDDISTIIRGLNKLTEELK